MRLSVLAATLSLVSVASVAFAGSSTVTRSTTDHEKHDERYQIGVKPGQRLEVQLDTGAGLEITGWDKNEAVIETRWRESKCPDARVDVVTIDDGVRVTSKYAPDTGDTHSCSMEIEIHVPKKFDVRVKSSGGSIALSDLRGTIQGHTGGGELHVEHLRGSIDLRTGGGAITVKDSDLDGTLETGGGHVSFSNVTGPVRASSGSEQGVKRGKTKGDSY